MSELAQAISEMRNMRESYDQLAGAAEAYNEGKPALAEAITAKGVEAAATDSLATMAEKVMTISQDTYEIDGGEMYAKQLFGVANNDIVPGYWNLYDILAQLLSDGRLVNYGGILLAEYYKGYDSLALSGAGAGGAYVVSDKDEQGNFIMYTEDTTHTWATKFDGKGNRWVAYCFADEYHDFQITDTNISPRSIFIGRKVGTIACLVNTRLSQIVVPNGNELNWFDGQARTHNFGRNIIFRNTKRISGLGVVANSESLYSDAEQCGGMIGSNTSIVSIILAPKNGEIYTTSNITYTVANNATLITRARKIYSSGSGFSLFRGSFISMIFDGIEELSNPNYGTITNNGVLKYTYFRYETNDKSKSVHFYIYGTANALTVIELQAGWCKPFRITADSFPALTEDSIYTYILQRLKQDEAGCGNGVTITLGTTNLNKLTSDESVALLQSLRNTYGYTIQ